MDDGVRDLAQAELWQESLERSRARRRCAENRSRSRSRAAEGPVSLRPAENGPHSAVSLARPAVRRRRLVVRRRRSAALGGIGMSALVLLVAVLPSVFGGSGRVRAVLAAHTLRLGAAQGGPTIPPNSGGVAPVSSALLNGRGKSSPPRKCQAAIGSSNYFNPLAAAHVTPERIDQGVDYAGSGTLAAIGAAKITYMAMSGTGWPGAFIEYRLLDGTDAGCYVFYAEGVKPVAGLRVGTIVGPGQPVASIIAGWSTGIEIGWGAGVATLTYAAARHEWSARSDAHSKASPSGRSFSALIAALGGPPGKVEG